MLDIRIVAGFVGSLTSFLGLLMSIPLGISLCLGETDSQAFLLSMVITIAAGFLLAKAGRKSHDLSNKECFAAVTLGWVGAAAFTALPFVFAGSLTSYTDAFFEAMSGLTTTGATVLRDIEAQPHGILFWRSFLHWLGGMGIIVLFIAVLPNLGPGAMRLFKAEVPGPVPERLEPRIRDTAKSLWLIYLGISIVQAALLRLGGMSVFDSVTHTFGTMATGGFSTKTASVGAWESPFIQWTIVAFMLIAGGNFALYHRLLRNRRFSVLKDEEAVSYLVIVACAAILLISSIHPTYDNLGKTVRDSCFQVASIITTTGFATADFDTWPFLAKGVLFILMFIGGCAGSTGGAIKVRRVLVVLKHAFAESYRSLHPRAVTRVEVYPVLALFIPGFWRKP